ncbi:bifunctional adenosylcobinamide kinase/adenosylcobinamide-phosphate guanylyltransferase [Breoghania sp. L-A4]|uniref:bifunctional adenosylcobinamide kinase/adenosylcobinamide-phosphate guanylyltransferase n=1 Tax=Breoghania sp. L-A4 TaxID=2304600 RepID=UPI000E359C98|nr:bifunctional adenosylcobinamide kinase/adenosylcobinamide-phosphate guanylyltransferase [Breoghania sp. L-A4]AXS40913.1 bifunctional adenosylcobinamide kinase/adenosylcobinamide-phosphate guanylyltransferase [Breoghania sp. L-A4]
MSLTTQKSVPPGTLVLGGARSGKSAFAEDLVKRSGLELVYIATAQAGDGEMRERIETHRGRRGAGWRTIEEPLALTRVLSEHAKPGRAVLVDCLTLWLSNLMVAERDLDRETAALAEAVRALDGPVVFVSNEVGMGIVPDNRMARDFRDAQGRLNQSMAQMCGRVIFVAAGQPLLLKPSPYPDIRL